MGQYTLPGPDRKRFNRKQLADYLGVSLSTLDRMIAERRFPRGRKPTLSAWPFWTGDDVAAWLHISERMQGEEPEGPADPPEKAIKKNA